MKNILYNSLIVLGFCFILSYSILKVPRYHYQYVRDKVGSRVVKITNEKGNHGGTGVHVKVSSGKTYILTNDHVCEVAKDGTLYVSTDYSERPMPRKVIERADFTDLCLVEPIDNIEGLTLGQEPNYGDLIRVVGHPKLMPITMTEGEILGEDIVNVFTGLSLEDCTKPKYKIGQAGGWFFGQQACFLNIKSYLTTIHILPGSSGSPAVDFWGNIVGLAYAGDNDINWGILVELEDIKKFLKPY